MLRGGSASRTAVALAQAAARAFGSAAAEVVPASSPFLRFSNPFPAAIDHSPLLSSIPETQVRINAG